MTIKFTAQDLSFLEDCRLERLRELHASTLTDCFLRLQHEMLVVHCSEPWCVDELMSDLDAFIQSSWLVLGVRSVSICYAGEEVYCAKTRIVRQRCVSK